jgi:competence protein ComEC
MPLSVRLLIAIVPGVAAGVLASPLLVGAVGIAVAATGGFATLAHGRGWRRTRSVSALVALSGVAWLLGAYAVDRAMHAPLRSLLESRLGGFAIDSALDARLAEPVRLEGRLRGDAAPSGTGAVLLIDVARVWMGEASERAPGGLSASVGGTVDAARLREWRAGRTVRLPVMLRRPARYLNAGVADGERALARRGVALVGAAKSGSLVEVVARGSWLDEAAASLRARVRRVMATYVAPLDAQSAAVATAILIGDRAAMAADEERRLQEAGTYHVIAISGGNIALLTALLLGLLWGCGVRGPGAALVSMPALVLYAFVVSGGASVVRATAMAAVYLALRVIDQRTSALHAIALTAAVMLLAVPLEIVDVGFWLTFGATAAIVAGTARTGQAAGAVRPWWRRALLVIGLASLWAELALMPIGALVFQRVSVAGLILNLAAVPSMAVVQVAAALTVAVDALGVPGAATAAGGAAHAAAQVLLRSARLVDVMPWSTWRVPSPALTVMAGYYLALIAWFLLSRPPIDSRRRRIAARSAGAGAALAFLWIAASPPTLARSAGDGLLRLTVIDAGQGDALLVTFPDGRTMAVDAGGVSPRGDFDIGDRVIGPALRARGLGRVDYFLLTHPDPDHIGGAASVVRDFEPGEVWTGVAVANHEPSERLRETAAAVRASWREIGRGDRLWIGGVEVRVHHPPTPDWERQRVRNDDSVVLELRLGTVALLLTGDIEREAERALAGALDDLPPVVILKSPHHGSATSSSAEFLTAVKPRAVLISCGRGNPYGHPVRAVLDRYRGIGAAVFRTDLEGQIELATDGAMVDVRTFTGRRWLSR